MQKDLELYVEECKWLAEKGFLDGEGLYLIPGADAIPLMQSNNVGHMTGISSDRSDILAMAKTIEDIGGSPSDVFGNYVGATLRQDDWQHYSHAVADVVDTQSIKETLQDKKFDYIIFKGFVETAFPGVNDVFGFENFVDYIVTNHTKDDTTILASFAQKDNYYPDGASMARLKDLGFENVTHTRGKIDQDILNIRCNYSKQYEPIAVTGNGNLNSMGGPDLSVDFNHVMIPSGDFIIYQKLDGKK